MPQQEEKIQQIIDLAKRLYGEELSGNVLWGKNYNNFGQRKQIPRFVHLRRKSLED